MACVSPFLALPPELICQIFEAADNLSVVVSLSETARIFNNIWRQHAASIYHAVAPHSTLSFKDIEKLLDVQEEAEVVGLSSHEGVPSQHRAVIRTKRLIYNNLCAWNARRSQMYRDVHVDPWSYGTNKGLVHQAFYRILIIGMEVTAPHLQSRVSTIVSECKPQDWVRMFHLATGTKPTKLNDSFGPGRRAKIWEAGCDAVIAYVQSNDTIARGIG